MSLIRKDAKMERAECSCRAAINCKRFKWALVLETRKLPPTGRAQGCIQCKHVPICVWFYFIVNLITLCPKFVSRRLCLPVLACALLAALAGWQCLELWLEIIAISATDQRK